MFLKNIHSNRFVAVASDQALDLDHPLNKGRVGWWYTPPGIASAGSRLLNLCGRNHGAITNSPLWTSTGRGDVGLTFDGTNRYVDVGPASAFPSSPYSYAITVMTTTLSGVHNAIFNSGPNSAYGVFLNSAALSCQQQGGSDLAVTTAVVGVSYRVGFTFDGTTANSYLNGRLVTSLSRSVGSNTTNRITIGADTANSRYWSGLINDVSIWSRTVSALEMDLDYKLSRLAYRLPDSPLRFASTTSWFVANNSPSPYPIGTVSDLPVSGMPYNPATVATGGLLLKRRRAFA